MTKLNFQKLAYISTFALYMTTSMTNGSAIAFEAEEQVNATGYLTPESYTKTIPVGETLSLDRTITVQVPDKIETATIAPEKLDILFLADNTDSMGAAIQNVQNNAQTLLNSLSEKYQDVQFGVAKYYGDPQEKTYAYEDTGVHTSFSKTFTYLETTKTCVSGQGASYPCYKYKVDYQEGDRQSSWTSFLNQNQYERFGQSHTKSWSGNIKEQIVGELGATNAYELQSEISSNITDSISAIDNWSADQGRDWQEGNFFGLHQAATNGAEINGYGTGHNTNWRDDAKKVIVWFGDAQSHTNTVTQLQVTQALADKDISVVAIHTRSTERSETQGLDANSQASTIAAGSNGAYASVYSSELTSTIENLIGAAAVETIHTPQAIDLSFGTQGDLGGLHVTYSCTDRLGCNGVKDGETRSFQMDITTNSAGEYNFRTVEYATGATANNTVYVSFPD